MITTSELLDKVYDALWPFHPDNQPEALVADYEVLKQKLSKSTYQQVAIQNPNQEISFANNPFERHDNEELTFLGRDLNKPAVEIRSNHYGRNADYELYGPIWIYITLLVEFVILGHLTNYFANAAKQGSGNSELLALLTKKTADQSLKRIMKISFFLGVFYFGVPFVTYLMFKSKQAMETTYV